jgi:hypothetical protein
VATKTDVFLNDFLVISLMMKKQSRNKPIANIEKTALE